MSIFAEVRNEASAGTPLVSVIMGVYNRRHFLAETIDSVLGQTLRNFELIAVDDGSTDGSGEILERYARQDNRVVVLSAPRNAGIAASLNRAIARARGRYLAVMDSDDVTLPHRLEAEFKHLEAHPEIVLLGAHVKLIDYDGAEVDARIHLPEVHLEIDQALLGAGWPIVHPTVMMRSDLVREAGGYNEGFRSNVDHELFLRLAERGSLANLPDVLLSYRIHHRAMTAQRTSLDHCFVEQAIQEACTRRSLPYPPPVQPVNRGLSFDQIYWRTGVRGGRQLIRLLLRSPGAFAGQILLTLRRSKRVRRALRIFQFRRDAPAGSKVLGTER